MSGLFSHPSVAPDAPSDRPDLQVSVTVRAPVDHAWAGLTEHLHLWWPADHLSRWGDESFFDLEDNALVETSAQEDENVWGEVTDRDPGRWLVLSWRHVGSTITTQLRADLLSGEGVERADAPVNSTPREGMPDLQAGSGGGAEHPETTLRLTHSGWSTAEPQELYDFYRDFWPTALSRYRRFMGGS